MANQNQVIMEHDIHKTFDFGRVKSSSYDHICNQGLSRAPENFCISDMHCLQTVATRLSSITTIGRQSICSCCNIPGKEIKEKLKEKL